MSLLHLHRIRRTYPVKFTNRSKLPPVSAIGYCAFMQSSPRTIARRIVDQVFGQVCIRSAICRLVRLIS